MKLYKISSPGSNVVALEPDEAITLGERGRGRHKTIVHVIGEGPEIRAKQSDAGIVLVRGDWDAEEPPRCIVVINTTGGYQQYRSYDLYDDEGVDILATGYFASGQAGRAGSGKEILAIVRPGATFRLTSKYASHWYGWDGETWVIEAPEERNARLALEIIEQGGGEWL